MTATRTITGISVTSAVCRKLHAAFPNIPIYREHIGENYSEPSFFVWTSNVQTYPHQGTKLIQKHWIEINYFPPHGGTNRYEEMQNIAIQLLEALHCIEMDSLPVWSISPEYRIIDHDMLQFSAVFRIETDITDIPCELMGEIEQRSHV